MRTLAIPSIGDVVTVARDWTFTCIAEYRNAGLMDYLRDSGIIAPDAPTMEPEPPLCGQTVRRVIPARPASVFWAATPERIVEAPCRLLVGHTGECNQQAHYPRDYCRYACTIPAGTQLRVDRIYIRKGKKEYDSFTFWALGLSKKRVRFFARLSEVNQMVVADDPSEVSVAKPLPLRAILIRDEEVV